MDNRDLDGHYLNRKIVERRETPCPCYGMTVGGYTLRSGAPTSTMIRIEGEKRWRRLMVWQFSNAGTLFVRYKGRALIVREYDLPEPTHG